MREISTEKLIFLRKRPMTATESTKKVETLLTQIERELAPLKPRRIDPTYNIITYLGDYFVDFWIMTYKGKFQLRIGRSEKLRTLQNPFDVPLTKCVKFVTDWLETNRAELDYENTTKKYWADVKIHLMDDFGKDDEEAGEVISKYLPSYRPRGLDILKIDPSDIAASLADAPW